MCSITSSTYGTSKFTNLIYFHRKTFSHDKQTFIRASSSSALPSSLSTRYPLALNGVELLKI
ncbi:hypothetical protein AKJ16_DCAP21513 [Drosera capensis]